MRRLFSWLPSLLIAALCFAIVVAKIWLSGKSLGNLSTAMTVGAAGVSLVGFYFLAAAFVQRLRRTNNMIIAISLLCLVSAEAALRLGESFIPRSLVLMLPIEDRHQILENRGLFTIRALQGEGLLYRYKPHWQIKSQPWVQIDENGYRNPPNTTEADIVVLGDSTSFNRRSAKDVGAVLREQGFTVMNLAFSGYGTRHQLEAYRRMVLQRKIPHKAVVVNFCICNDIPDSQAYERLEKLGRDWQSTRGTQVVATAFPFPFKPPWVVSIIAHAPEAFIQKFIRSAESPDKMVPVTLSRGTVELQEADFFKSAEFLEPTSWEPALRALREIIRLAQATGAKPIIGLWPENAIIYAHGLKTRPDLKKNADELHAFAVRQLRLVADKTQATFFDYTPHIVESNDKTLALVYEANYHPGPAGIKVMADVLGAEVREMLNR